MNIFWAPKSSNKKIVQIQKYKIEKKINWKNRFGKQKKEKQIELFGHQKSSKNSDFLGDNKQKLNFLEKKIDKFREFFLKNIKNGTF